MNNILIIADCKVAKRFIEIVTSKQISELNFYIVAKDKEFFNDLPSNIANKIVLDPTSLYRLKSICKEGKYNSVFIAMQDANEAFEVYKNIRVLNKKVRIVALDNDDRFNDIEDAFLNILNSNEILANRLYDYLPTVPLVAQSIGLNQGEIMEVLVPFASSFSYRHISSIPQKKWRIVAIYRDNKLLLPTNATMIKPRDRLLIVGNPNVLNNVYKKIKNKSSQFPEPYGKNFYLILNIKNDKNDALKYLEDAIYLLDKFNNKELIVRVYNISNLEIVEKIKSYERDNIRVYISYDEVDEGVMFTDIQNHDVGLVLISYKSFNHNGCYEGLNEFKKLIYLFGNKRLNKIKESLIINTGKRDIEEISTVAFFISEALKTKLIFGDFNPTGDFEESKDTIEHIEILSQVHNYPIEIIQKRENPVEEVKRMQDVLVVMPFKKEIELDTILLYFKRNVISLMLQMDSHPKLLIPIEE